MLGNARIIIAFELKLVHSSFSLPSPSKWMEVVQVTSMKS